MLKAEADRSEKSRRHCLRCFAQRSLHGKFCSVGVPVVGEAILYVIHLVSFLLFLSSMKVSVAAFWIPRLWIVFPVLPV